MVSILLFLAVISWMGVILSFSSDSGEISDRKSSAVLETVKPAIERVEKSIKIELIDKNKIHFYVRKNAHMFNYFVLATLVFWALKSVRIKGGRLYAAAYAIATLFSMLDEYYQTHIPGRSGKFADVLVDNAGIVIALILAGFAMNRFPRKDTQI